MSGISTTLQKFCYDRIRGFASAHARLRAPLFTRLFFAVLSITVYSQDATTDVNAKYVKRRGSVQGCAFWGVAKAKFNMYIPFFPQNRHFGARFRRYLEILGRKTALALEVLRVNDP